MCVTNFIKILIIGTDTKLSETKKKAQKSKEGINYTTNKKVGTDRQNWNGSRLWVFENLFAY